MKIGIDTLFESPRFPTGATGYMINLLKCLAAIDRDNEYFVFVSEANRHLYQLQQDNFHPITCWASNEHLKKRILAQQLQVPGLVRRHGIQVFNSPGNTAPLALPCRSVLTIKTMHHYRFADSLGWARAAYRRSMVYLSAKLADCIIANSISNKSDIVHYLGVSPDKVVIVHEAVDKHLFQQEIPESVMEAKLASMGVRLPFVLNVSSMWRYKNQISLIRAFLMLKNQRRIPHQLVLVGGSDQPDYFREVRHTIERSGLAHDVKLVGYLSHADICYLYRAADLFVYPSLYETFGLTLVEAMASGAPIICSDRGSLPEIVGDAGLVVDPEDLEELASSMYRVIDDARLRRALVQRGFVRVNAFAWENTASETRDVYLRVGGRLVGRVSLRNACGS